MHISSACEQSLHTNTTHFGDFETVLHTAISHAVVPLYRTDDHNPKQQLGVVEAFLAGVQAFAVDLWLATGKPHAAIY